MVKRNPNMAKLQSGYLFPEIARRKNEFLRKNPKAKIISLGIGDTTQPITHHIARGLSDEVSRLRTKKGYTGYGAEQGLKGLRDRIAEKLYKGTVEGDEVFVSDGAKPDTARLQVLFGSNATIAVQDPSYPVYVDSSVILGQTGNYNQKKLQFDGIEYMQCNPQNNFFPDLQIGKAHGKLLIKPFKGMATKYFFPLYHPAAALYDGSMREVLKDDFQKILKVLREIEKRQA